MATITVTTLADENDGGATEASPGGVGLSLREAIALANASVGVDDTIVFDAGLNGTIYLDGGDGTGGTAGATLSITDTIIIEGDGRITISGDADHDDVSTGGASDVTDIFASVAAQLDDNVRLFDATAALTLDGLVLTGGVVSARSESGGAVRGTSVTITLTNATVSGNQVSDRGDGGGIAASIVNLTNSTVSGNSADDDGGGIAATTAATLINTTVSGNNAFGQGGGVFTLGTAALINSTVSGNRAQTGGGVAAFTDGSATELINSIVLGNTASAGVETAGTVNLTGGNIVGTNVFQGISDVGDTSAAAVFAATVDIGGGVLAGVLADNGGPVETIALRRDLTNPALDRSTNTAPATDARGEARVDRPGIANSNGSAADLGAFELESLAPSITSNGGGGAALVSIAENGKAVVTVAATDPDGQTPVFLIDGGSDAALFQIDAATGALFFEAAPDFEAPADVDGNNVYDVIVRASDGALSDTQSLSVTVTDVAGVKIVGTAADNMIDIARTVAGQPLPGNEGDRISGKAGDDTITAGAGDDVVGGGLGDDKLDGGAGNDVLFAGKGDNRLTGGEGDDVFVIVRKHAFTKIVDYEDGEVIQFAKKAFPGIGPKGVLKAEFFHVGAEAETQHQRILYDDESGKILYLRHGSETQNPRVLLKIGEGLDHLDHSDFLVI